jgi:hypothetical protein
MSLGEINVALSAAIGLITPLTAQLDLALFGSFGLGAIQADLSAQFNAALSLSASLSFALGNPIANYQQALVALITAQASITAALAAGIPAIGVDIGLQLSSTAAITGALGAKLGGISALIEAALQVKLGASQLMAEFTSSLSAGSVDILAFGFDAPNTAAQVGADASVLFNGGLPGIQAGDNVSGVMIVTKNPSAAAAIAALFKVS